MTPRPIVFILLLAFAGVGSASAQAPERSGAEVYSAGCVTCHGPDGKGAAKTFTGFDLDLPDFTDCEFSTPEPDPDWAATIHLGGRARAFDPRMPAFTDALTPQEIGRVIGYLRGFCTDRGWPRGDLNLPRPLVTEKAFPENEAVVTSTFSASQPGSIVNEFVYERRLGKKTQYEVVVPIDFQQNGTGGWSRGLGDVAIAAKHVLFHNLDLGTILSGGGEVHFPTGKENEGLGGGVTVFEPFVTMSQVLPRDGFFHVHVGFEMPAGEIDPNESFWRVAVGKTFSEARWGRAWSPIVELLGSREHAAGEESHWDLLPQMQVTLSKRQHIMLNGGLRFPLNDRESRTKSVMVYFLWDWFDGGVFEGWR